ncbi:MAG: hypothetical protein ABFD90_13520 [Phycisphaerales bacterium]
MKSIRDVKTYFRNAAINTNSAGDKVVLNDALNAGGLTSKERAVPAGPSVRRFIMHNPMAKLTAAAVVVLVGVLGISFLDTSSTSAYGMTEALDLVEQARTLHIQGWRIQGAERQPFEDWYDLESGRYRLEYPGLDAERDFEVCDGQYIMRASRGRQPVGEKPHRALVFEKVDPNQQGRGAVLLEQYRRLRQIEGFHKIKQDMIDGETFDVWQGEYVLWTNRVRLQVWLSPTTAAIGKLKYWKEEGEGGWTQTSEYTRFERNVLLPPELFFTDPPATGYEITNSKKTATIPVRRNWFETDIYEDTQFRYASLNYRVWPVFFLPDGSLLAGYQGIDGLESRDQSRYFEGLHAGGPLAKLPVEVYALSPEPNTRNVLFIGFHLACTQKETDEGRRWFEWILYVPDGEPPKPDGVLFYRIRYRLNVQRTEDIQIRAEQPPVHTRTTQKIETEEDFNRLILSAIAERSDGGVVPEQITYENVLRITEQIRTSMSQ